METVQTLSERVSDAIERAARAGAPLSEAFSLATVDGEGRPSSRVVLLKEADRRGLVFYTNTLSRKGRELDNNPRAAMCFWWGALQEQIRIEGTVERVSSAEADAYFAVRPRGSQLGAWASNQSAPLATRRELDDTYARMAARYDGRDVPRPPHWTGYRLLPDRFEFWYGREDRLHDRFLYTRSGNDWREERLYP